MSKSMFSLTFFSFFHYRDWPILSKSPNTPFQALWVPKPYLVHTRHTGFKFSALKMPTSSTYVKIHVFVNIFLFFSLSRLTDFIKVPNKPFQALWIPKPYSAHTKHTELKFSAPKVPTSLIYINISIFVNIFLFFSLSGLTNFVKVTK